jgi:uncharacterized membrane protein
MNENIDRNSDAVPPLWDGKGIIYNVTIKVASPIEEAWLRWLKAEHIPDIMATGFFTHAVTTRLL